MTMLDRMRRHKGWLKWSLGIVVVTFVLLYVPSFLQTTAAPARRPTDIARDRQRPRGPGRDRTSAPTSSRSSRCASAYGDSSTSRCSGSSASPQRIVQQLVDEEAVLAEADRLGITRQRRASCASASCACPGSRRTASSSATTRYRADAADAAAADARRRSSRTELRKLAHRREAAGRGHRLGARVATPKSTQEYRKRNEKVKLDLAVFTANQFRAGIQPTDAEIARAVRRATRRRTGCPRSAASGILVDRRRGAAREDDRRRRRKSRRATSENLPTYSTPEQVRASHILLQDRGQGRGGRARRSPRACSPRSRPAGTSPRSPSSTPKTTRARTTAATSTTSAAARW